MIAEGFNIEGLKFVAIDLYHQMLRNNSYLSENDRKLAEGLRQGLIERGESPNSLYIGLLEQIRVGN